MDTVLLYILGVVVVLLGVAISIALHEVGHLVPAKRFGVKVGQYMIGFGPTIFSRRRGETEYGIKAIPLGGYISMAGMYPPAKPGSKPRTASTGFFNTMVQDARDSSAEQVQAGDEDRVFYKLAWWKRVVIMLGGPVVNLLIGVVLWGVVLCVFGLPQSTTTVGNVSECVVPASSEQTECAADDTPTPAAEAGLQPGDRIVSIDGTSITSADQIGSIIRVNAGTELDLVVERDGAEQQLTLTPILNQLADRNSLGQVVTDLAGNPVSQEVGFIGIGYTMEVVQMPVTAVLPAVGDNIVSVAKIVATLPGRLVQTAQAAFGGEERDPNGPISVVGVGRIAGELTSYDELSVADRASSLINLVASLNIALFVFNLIPLLPLDGGHVIGAVWEALRRRLAKIFHRPEPGPVDIAKLIPLTLTIVAVLGISSALLIYADIVNPVKLF